MPKGVPKSGRAPNQKTRIPTHKGGKRVIPPRDEYAIKYDSRKKANMDLAKDIPSERGDMTLNDYQHYAKEFIRFPDKFTITYPALGLAEEAGEVCGKVCKAIRDHKSVTLASLPHDLLPELGDCLWQLSTLAYNLGLTLEEVAKANLSKLKDRAERNAIGGSGDVR